MTTHIVEFHDLQESTDYIEVTGGLVTQQRNSTYCGVFSIAFATGCFHVTYVTFQTIF